MNNLTYLETQPKVESRCFGSSSSKNNIHHEIHERHEIETSSGSKTVFSFIPCLSWSLPSFFIAALFAILAGTPLAADEPLPTDDDKPQAKPAAKPAAPAVEDKLIRALNPAAKEQLETEIARMERAIEGMRQANKRIEADDTSSATLEVQRRVIEDLEKLLERLKQQQQNRKNNPQQSQQQPQDQQQGGRQKLPKPQLDPQNSGARPQPRNQGRNEPSQRNDDQKARDAQERLDAAKAAQADDSRRQQMIKDVWGHLPPHLREAMRNTFSEKYLPKYEDLVKRYYESLAEKNRSRSEKQPSSSR